MDVDGIIGRFSGASMLRCSEAQRLLVRLNFRLRPLSSNDRCFIATHGELVDFGTMLLACDAGKAPRVTLRSQRKIFNVLRNFRDDLDELYGGQA